MMPQANCRPMGMRYDPESGRSCVKLQTLEREACVSGARLRVDELRARIEGSPRLARPTRPRLLGHELLEIRHSHGRKHDADGDGELVARDEHAADLAGADLGHVEDDDGRDETDTEPCDETTDDDGGKGGSGEHPEERAVWEGQSRGSVARTTRPAAARDTAQQQVGRVH